MTFKIPFGVDWRVSEYDQLWIIGHNLDYMSYASSMPFIRTGRHTTSRIYINTCDTNRCWKPRWNNISNILKYFWINMITCYEMDGNEKKYVQFAMNQVCGFWDVVCGFWEYVLTILSLASITLFPILISDQHKKT